MGLTGQEPPRFEITAGAWLAHPQGSLQAGGTRIDLQSDLKLQDRATFAGKLSLRLGRKHRINVEGIPYRFTGQTLLSRNIVFRGVTYRIQDTIASNAALTYVSAGYQYDLLSRPRGRFGLSAEAAYLGAAGTLTSLVGNVSATESRRIALPLAGADFLLYLLPRSGLLQINGTVKGMSFGDYGSYIQAGGNLGVRLFKGVYAQAGYLFANPEIHNRAGSPDPVEVAPRFSGPVFSIAFRSRER